MRAAVALVVVLAACDEGAQFSEGIAFPPNVTEPFVVTGTSASDLWAHTNPPQYWDGSTWTLVFDATIGIAEGAGTSIALATSDGLEVARTTPAGELERFATPTALSALYNIGDEIWGAAFDGSVQRLDGTTWTEVRPAGLRPLRGIVGTPTRVIGVMDGGDDVTHYDGATWTEEAPPFPAAALIDAVPTSDGFSAFNPFVPGGEPPQIISWDGAYHAFDVELANEPQFSERAQRTVALSDGNAALLIDYADFRGGVPAEISSRILRVEDDALAAPETVVLHDGCAVACPVGLQGGANALVSPLTPTLHAITWSFGAEPRIYVVEMP